MDAREDAVNRLRPRLTAALGWETAKRVRAYRDGGLYVESRGWAAFGAWLVDFALVALLAAPLAMVSYFSLDPREALGPSVMVEILTMAVVALLYGWCYGNGRGLGAVLAGTRLVRNRDGSRIGLGTAGLVMLARVLGLVLVAVFLNDSGPRPNVSKVSIDVRATDRLRAAGFERADLKRSSPTNG